MTEKLQQYAFPASNKKSFFAFDYKETFNEKNGWTLYEPVAELKRQVLLSLILIKGVYHGLETYCNLSFQ